MKYRYCYICGTETIIKNIDGRKRSFCGSCGIVLYENPTPSVAVVLTDPNRRILLVRRSVEPGIGEWCLPGGFIEMGETPSQAAVRELKEEIGIEIGPPQLLSVGSHLNGHYGDVLIIGFSADINPDDPLVPGDDVSEAVFFPLDNRPRMIFRVHEEFVEQWLKKSG